MTTTLLKQYLTSKLEAYCFTNHSAKMFMQRIKTDLSDIYSDLWIDEESADHKEILFYHFLPNLSDSEVEATMDNLIEIGIDKNV